MLTIYQCMVCIIAFTVVTVKFAEISRRCNFVLVIAMSNSKIWYISRYLQALLFNITCVFLRAIIVEIKMFYKGMMNFTQKTSLDGSEPVPWTAKDWS